jgi:predicted RNase H-like HicB family nuclease
MSQGSTPEEAVRLLREARQLVIEHHLEHGLDVPLPAAMQVTQ